MISTSLLSILFQDLLWIREAPSIIEHLENSKREWEAENPPYFYHPITTTFIIPTFFQLLTIYITYSYNGNMSTILYHF